ncbi:MAG: class I SAM-dependent methyltransferase [Patescibacteria group bacterium]
MDYRDFRKFKQKAEEHFWYKARGILINNLLNLALPKNNPTQKIIEIGCGTGIQLPLLAQFGEVEGLDLVPKSIEQVKKSGFTGRVFDIETENLEKNSADVISCFDVLEHLKQDDLALIKIAQALRPNGIFLFSIPAIPWLFGPHDQAAHHYRRYSRKDIKKKLESAGLEIKMIRHWNSWLLPMIITIRLIKKIINPKDQANSDTKPLPKFTNYLLYQILALETKLNGKGLVLPWGLSLYGYAIKKKYEN